MMHRFLLLLALPIVLNAGCVSYRIYGGRFGDQLLHYAKAKWFAHNFNLKFYYSPYPPYTEKLVMHTKERHCPKRLRGRQVGITKRDGVGRSCASPVYITVNHRLDYKLGYFYQHPNWDSGHYITDWKGIIDNPEFREILREMIRPVQPLQTIHPPKGKLSAALHVRKGGGYDSPLFSKQFYDVQSLKGIGPRSEHSMFRKRSDASEPLKFPPNQFYIDQIGKLCESINFAPLHIHLFTDDKKPKKLLEEFRSHIPWENVTIVTSKQGVLEDFFSMLNYDYLIRSQSNFSQAVHLIGKFKKVFFPMSYEWRGDALIMTRCGVSEI